jgi:hypothetical protein
MARRFTQAEFDRLIASNVANTDLIGILRDIQQDDGSWEIFEALMSLSSLRAVHQIATALQAIEMNTRPGRI